MATVTTAIEQDQEELYEYTLSVNDEQVHTAGGFTHEEYAVEDARVEFQKWFGKNRTAS